MVWTPGGVVDLRDRLGLTQQQLADTLDVSLRSVQMWEGGHTAISRRNAKALDRLADEQGPAGPVQESLGLPAKATSDDPRDLADGALWLLINQLTAEAQRRYYQRKSTVDTTDQPDDSGDIYRFRTDSAPTARRTKQTGPSDRDQHRGGAQPG